MIEVDPIRLGTSDAGEVRLPLDVVTSALAILGQRGTGKSTAAAVLVEQVVKAGGHVVILDPVGAWFGCTHAGTGPGLEGIVIGGEHGDVPLEETGGQLVAELVTSRHWPVVVIDMKLLRKGQQLRFMADYCETLFHLNREALMQVFEEADRAAPQASRSQDINAMRTLGAVEDIVKLGRSRGLGAMLITQRPASLNKNALEVCENVLFFRLKGTNDRKAARGWVEANGDADELKRVMDTIASLKVGECWLYTDTVQRVRVGRRQTFDSSSTPKVGQAAAQPTERTPVDLGVLRQRMAETIERAKADDPKALRQRIKDLEERLSRFPENAKTGLQPCNHETEIRRLQQELRSARDREEDVAGLRAIISLMQERMDHAGELLRFQGEAVSQMPHRVKEMAAKSKTVIDDGPARAKSRENIPANIPPTEEVEHADLRTPIERRSQNGARNIPRTFPTTQPAKSPTVGHSVDDEVLSGPERRILDAIAWLGALGIDEPEQSAVAFLAGYTYNAGSYNNPRGSLRRRGLVEYLPKSRIRLTEQGLALANSPEVAPTNAELHERVLAKLDGPMRRLLVPLLQAYPRPLPDAELAAAAGYTAGAGSFNNPKGRLRSLGLVEYPQPRHVVARALLFPAENVGV